MGYHIAELSVKAGPAVMALLVDAAYRHQTLSYANVARRIEKALRMRRVSARNMGGVVGLLMDRISEVDPKAPPLNALVVSVLTKVPGHGAGGYIDQYLGKGSYDNMDLQQKRAVLKLVHEAVFNFKHWDRIARAMFGRALPKSKSGESAEHDGKARRMGFSGPAEGPAHKRLKEYVKHHPRQFGAPKGCRQGKDEFMLESRDEIDVYFMTPQEELAVEVKPERCGEVDLRRGIFQCVKYRAVLQAQATVDRCTQRIRARLVSEERLPETLMKIARKLKVEVQVIKPLRS